MRAPAGESTHLGLPLSGDPAHVVRAGVLPLAPPSGGAQGHQLPQLLGDAGPPHPRHPLPLPLPRDSLPLTVSGPACSVALTVGISSHGEAPLGAYLFNTKAKVILWPKTWLQLQWLCGYHQHAPQLRSSEPAVLDPSLLRPAGSADGRFQPFLFLLSPLRLLRSPLDPYGSMSDDRLKPLLLHPSSHAPPLKKRMLQSPHHMPH